VTADTRATLPAPADGRLRHSVVFTVHMRNPQYYVSPAP
jgi:hypothetical protein